MVVKRRHEKDRCIIRFWDIEKVGFIPKAALPLIIATIIVNHLVFRILVNNWISCDVMYTNIFRKLELYDRDLIPSKGINLLVLNDSISRPFWAIKLPLSIREREAWKDCECVFLGDLLWDCLKFHLREIFPRGVRYGFFYSPPKDEVSNDTMEPIIILDDPRGAHMIHETTLKKTRVIALMFE